MTRVQEEIYKAITTDDWFDIHHLWRFRNVESQLLKIEEKDALIESKAEFYPGSYMVRQILFRRKPQDSVEPQKGEPTSQHPNTKI